MYTSRFTTIIMIEKFLRTPVSFGELQDEYASVENNALSTAASFELSDSSLSLFWSCFTTLYVVGN